MVQVWRGAAIRYSLALAASLALAGPAGANDKAAAVAANERLVALDGESFAARADQSLLTTRDAIFHQSVTLDFRAKTLGTAMPGDLVDVDGQEQVLTSIAHRTVDGAFAVDAGTLAAQAGQTTLSVQGALDHQPLEIDLGGTTLGELKAGDELALNGKPHTLWGVEKSASGTLFLADAKSDASPEAGPGSGAGIGLGVAAIIKFKQHKANPNQH